MVINRLPLKILQFLRHKKRLTKKIMNSKDRQKPVLMILGPTASGKTSLSYSIAQQISSEIINVDVGQFYKPLSIGTAKPDLADVTCPHHLFDLLDKPEDLSVARYRELVIEQVKTIHQRNNQALLVGGSLFYIKSLFFPPAQPSVLQQVLSGADVKSYNQDAPLQELWDQLYTIDPERAKAIHPHDRYRIMRALDLWYATGQKPSLFVPHFVPFPFDVHIIYLAWPRKILRERIYTRMFQMFEQGWVEEAEQLIDTSWEPFLKRKGLLGYPEIFAWIRAGKPKNKKNELIEAIYFETVHYAKRQETFAKSMFSALKMHHTESKKRLTTQIITEFTNESLLGNISIWTN